MYYIAKNMKKKYNIEVRPAASVTTPLHLSASSVVPMPEASTVAIGPCLQGDDRAHLFKAISDFLEAVGDRDFMVS